MVKSDDDSPISVTGPDYITSPQGYVLEDYHDDISEDYLRDKHKE